MTEPLVLIERVKNTIQLGESHFREFKSAFEGRSDVKKPRDTTRICKDIGEAMVSFANADGGDLLIGVEDNGEITGLKHDQEDIGKMLKAIETHIFPGQTLPILYKEILKIDDAIIIFFSVSKSTGIIYQLPDGRCVRRKDRQTIPIDVHSIEIERAEQKSREYDREFLDAASVSDLDMDLLTELASNYLPGISVEKYLQQIGLGDYTPAGLRLRRAALILFAKKVEIWLPRSELRVLKVNGTELLSGPNYNVVVDERFSGNAFRLLTNGWDFLRPFLIGKIEFGQDATFQSKYVYPEIACREALVNAIAHRDYTINNGIDFFIYTDRLTIRSPGLLLSTIKMTDLLDFKNVHESRNAYVSRLLRENKYMREMGEGIRRIYDILNDNEIGAPIIKSEDSSFSLTIENKSIYTSKELEWLSLFDSFNLTKQQKRIVALGLHDREISPHDIYQALNTNDRNTYDSVVTSLRVVNILQQIRNGDSAGYIARSKRIPKQKIGRFKVVAPGRAQILHQIKVLNAIFVYNLPEELTEEIIISFFSTFGTISQLHYPINRKLDKHYNYCFIHFTENQPAQDLIRKKTISINGHEANISEFIEKKKEEKRK